jgi:hypothetical protein
MDPGTVCSSQDASEGAGMSGATKAAVGLLLMTVAGGLAISPLGSSIPGWAYGGVLLAMVVGLAVGVRRMNRREDELDGDELAKRSTSVWLAGALAVRHGSAGPDGTASGELLAGPRGGQRVAGKPAEGAAGRSRSRRRGGASRREVR